MQADTQSNRVFEALRSDILACRLAPAAKLNIANISDRFGVSLGAAREALSRLIPEGLVRTAPQKGFSVAPVSHRELHDLTAARIELETICLREAIRRGGVEWETQAVAALHRLSRIPTSRADQPGALNPDWSSAHARFHRALVEACDNAVLLRLRDLLYDESERYRHWCLPLTLAGEVRDVGQEHEAILRAVLAGATEEACGLMQAHIQRTTDILARSPLISEEA